MPESVPWLTRRQPAGALERINRTMRSLGHAPITALPSIASEARPRAIAELFTPALRATTLLVTLAYFFHIMTFYFVIKWVPKIVVDMGFAASSAAGVLVWANVGGATGGAVLGLLTQRVSVKALTITTMLDSTVMVTAFGRTPHSLQALSIVCACAGFFTNASIVGLYAILAKAFPTEVRASGTGFAIGIGRGGSVLAPIVAGVLFTAGATLPTVALIMSLGSLLAAGTLLIVKLGRGRRPGRIVPMQSPFRADHVGSLLRPRTLLEARNNPEVDHATLARVEDEAILGRARAAEGRRPRDLHRRRVPPRGLHERLLRVGRGARSWRRSAARLEGRRVEDRRHVRRGRQGRRRGRRGRQNSSRPSR